MTTTQQQVGELLKAVKAKGIEMKDALPTIKVLVQAKIFSLDQLNEQNMPPGLDAKIKKKLLPPKRKYGNSEGPNKKAKHPISQDEQDEIVQPAVTSKPETILINRSPVLTLWAAVVAKHVYAELSLAEALSLGSAVAASTAKAKGTSLGIFAPEPEGRTSNDSSSSEMQQFQILGTTIHAKKVSTSNGKVVIRAVTDNGKVVQNPLSTWKLLNNRFGDALGFVMAEMSLAAESCLRKAKRDEKCEALESSSYSYYVHIRPDIPSGTKGWGAHGRFETRKLSDFYK